MLEIGYRKNTGEITRSAYSPELTGGHLKPVGSEGIAVLDMLPLDNLKMWLYNEMTQTLIPNPSYVEPEPVRDLEAEIDGLKAKIAILEKGLNVGTNKRTVS